MNIVKKYTLGDIAVEAIFDEKENKKILIKFKITPMYPFEAEILKTYMGQEFEWSYIDKENAVVFIPRDIEISYKNTNEFLHQVFEGLFFLKPKLAHLYSFQKIRERLVENDWLAWVTEETLEARKKINNGRIYVKLQKTNKFWYTGYISVLIHSFSLNDSEKILNNIKRITTIKVKSKYPLLEIEIPIRKIPLPVIENFLKFVTKIMSR